MGRMKGLFCSFCLDRSPDRSTNEQSFGQGIDVSHLATSHNSYNLNTAHRSSANLTPVCDLSNKESNNNYSPQQNQQPSGPSPKPSNCIAQIRAMPESPDGRDNSPSIMDQPTQNCDNNLPLPSPHSSSSRSNIYEQSQESQQPVNDDVSIQHNNNQQQQNQEQQSNHQRNQTSQNNRTSTKLSYEIISVREPLAKILAEQQRQILGDHEYIEVYGERGSSCFYEEIAGSTTSSATYDQIGASSNHNYQALINAYAVTSRANESNRYNVINGNNIEQSTNNSNDDRNPSVDNNENIYNLDLLNDQVDNPTQGTSNPTPSTYKSSTINDNVKPESSRQILNDRINIESQSIPVYSVINKATRRNNAIIEASIESCRPPQPPPKNLPKASHNQSSLSAIQHYQESSIFMNNQCRSNSRNPPQIPSTSSASNNIKNSNDSISEPREAKEKNTRLPQPPPRYSKQQPMFNATRRPLPLPENTYELTKNNNVDKDNLLNRDEDTESLNNGYELLNTNFDEDQIDVGYERIRESHQYSGGSLASQFNPLQLLDNGGYESVQPIYSSPSNALAEPNYEAIGPATASELAAAATARLNAAVAVIDFLKQDQ